jgi:hypothetical protein
MADEIDVHEELMKIREARGKLTPRIVAEETKAKAHPLHHRVYDVDAREAASRYYISNAAKLLRVTFKETMRDGHTADLRHFWVVRGTKENPESTYEPITDIVQDPISREIMLRQMLRDWKRFKARYANYQEFSRMILDDPDFVDPDQEFGDGNGTEG